MRQYEGVSAPSESRKKRKKKSYPRFGKDAVPSYSVKVWSTVKRAMKTEKDLVCKLTNLLLNGVGMTNKGKHYAKPSTEKQWV